MLQRCFFCNGALTGTEYVCFVHRGSRTTPGEEERAPNEIKTCAQCRFWEMRIGDPKNIIVRRQSDGALISYRDVGTYQTLLIKLGWDLAENSYE